jgi:cytoskeletal protein RodZ
MGRHSALEGRHRRTGALLAQAGLVVVLGLVAVSVLFGSAVVRDRMVNGTFTGSETAAESSPRVATPEASPEPSPASSAPASRTAPPATGSDEPTPTADSSDQAIVPESRGASGATAPTSTASAMPRVAAPDTTSPTSSVSPTNSPAPVTPVESSFANCAEAKAAGVSMIPDADPRYDPKLDHDGDGFACDAHGDPPTRHRPMPTTSTTPTITPTLPPCPPPD